MGYLLFFHALHPPLRAYTFLNPISIMKNATLALVSSKGQLQYSTIVFALRYRGHHLAMSPGFSIIAPLILCGLRLRCLFNRTSTMYKSKLLSLAFSSSFFIFGTFAMGLSGTVAHPQNIPVIIEQKIQLSTAYLKIIILTDPVTLFIFSSSANFIWVTAR